MNNDDKDGYVNTDNNNINNGQKTYNDEYHDVNNNK